MTEDLSQKLRRATDELTKNGNADLALAVAEAIERLVVLEVTAQDLLETQEALRDALTSHRQKLRRLRSDRRALREEVAECNNTIEDLLCEEDEIH